MPQIGWLEILAVVIVAILVLGPKEFPVALKKIGSYVGKIKGIFSNFQKEVSSLSDEVNVEKEINNSNNQKNTKKEQTDD
tara:strand:- start:151 stop:390 length:240 start_codon:yes stop_codon:yes gene_type:complete